MPLLQVRKMKNMVGFFGTLLALFIVSGCVAQNSGKTNSSEQQIQPLPSQSADADVTGVEREISLVSVDLQNNDIYINIQGNQKLVYTSIKQSFPFGISVYLPETIMSDGFKTIMADNESIDDLIVSYADKEKTTVKVEILLNRDFDYKVEESNGNLKLTLAGEITENLTKKSQSYENKNDEEQTIQKLITQEEIVIPDETAIMTNIEFNTTEDGKSGIIVQTNHPVKYDITGGDNNKLYLNLYNTVIPDYHKRPIITKYFKSAVKSLMPIQLQGSTKTGRIEILVREQVPYRIERGENHILLFFEPSTIEPPEFLKANKNIVSGGQDQVAETSQSMMAINKSRVDTNKEKTLAEKILGSQQKYTGEKIKLDFYETDIKNVFRILRSVGKLNFAIDKDVEGKVTLTLEDPVPWDQVLDLVLKMNNLGKKRENNVIRIATVTTLQKEAKLEQDAITARKKSLEQEKSFEPLVTEYIPINYSDAAADVKPHIEQILSENRGKISVDKRTNMIIITDTQDTIDQAREIIYRLDQVTPQIMIEAKVVEVSKNFARDLGLGLSFNQAREKLTSTGQDLDFSMALNHPVAAPINAGAFNFWRVLGSSYLSLNAQIAASEVKGDVHVVSSPRILTLDNKKAKIKQGLEYAYLERDDTGGSSVKFKNIDLLLEVTPHVTPDKRIAMNIFLTKNDIDSITNGVPSLSTNEAQTELLVNDNDTIVIGGIVKTSDNKGVTGTPILSGIPYLGRLFRTETKQDKRNELLIFITPSIIQLDQRRTDFTSQKK